LKKLSGIIWKLRKFT